MDTQTPIGERRGVMTMNNFHGNHLLTYRSRTQHVVALSPCEASICREVNISSKRSGATARSRTNETFGRQVSVGTEKRRRLCCVERHPRGEQFRLVDTPLYRSGAWAPLDDQFAKSGAATKMNFALTRMGVGMSHYMSCEYLDMCTCNSRLEVA